MNVTVISDTKLLRRLRRLEKCRLARELQSRQFALRHALPVLRVETDGQYHYLLNEKGERVTGKMSWASVERFVSTHKKFVVEGFEYAEEIEGVEVEAQKLLAEQTKAFFGHC